MVTLNLYYSTANLHFQDQAANHTVVKYDTLTDMIV